MLNATVDVRRALERLLLDPNRRTTRASTLRRHVLAVARTVPRRLAASVHDPSAAADRGAGAHAPHARSARSGAHPAGPVEHLSLTLPAIRLRTRVRPVLGSRLARERVLPVGVAALLLVASIASVTPARSGGGTGDVDGPGDAPRIAIGGGDRELPAGYFDDLDAADVAPRDADAPDGFTDTPIEGIPLDEAGAVGADPAGQLGPGALPDGRRPVSAAAAPSAAPEGPYLIDGTLLKPIAVDTTVADSRDKLRSYRVQAGDTLTGIASRFGVSMMTIWWANDLDSKDDLHIGQTLVIPPVTGLVVTVKDGDTLESIAAGSGATPDEILEYNGLEDRNLIIGQTLIIPGARGEGIPTPKPAPVTRSGGSGSGGGGGGNSVRPPVRYSGGAFAWPTAGGYVSQYFHYGHYGIDIAGDYGTAVRAAAAGTVIYSGWKSNGGGYQVWIAHGSGLYTTYNHMSSLSVGVGERVGRGETIGRMGSSGWSTGPHLHFEVWRGPVWNGGSRVNPFAYL